MFLPEYIAPIMLLVTGLATWYGAYRSADKGNAERDRIIAELTKMLAVAIEDDYIARRERTDVGSLNDYAANLLPMLDRTRPRPIIVDRIFAEVDRRIRKEN